MPSFLPEKLKTYFKTGGSAVFLGRFPFSIVDKSGNIRKLKKKEILQLFPFLRSKEVTKGKRVSITEKGKKVGLNLRWIGQQPVSSSSIDVPLALFEKDWASAWIKFVPPDSEIIRTWDFPLKKLSGRMLRELHSLVENRFYLGIVKVRVESTPFLKRIRNAYSQAIKIRIENWSREKVAELTCFLKGKVVGKKKSLKIGNQTFFLLIPKPKSLIKATIVVSIGRKKFKENLKIKPAKRWTLLVVPTIHTDIGFTNTQEKVLRLRRKNLDKLIEAMEKNPDLKWNIEVSFLLEDYLKHCPEEKKTRILNLIKEGRLDVNAFYLNLLTGLSSGESLIRSLYFIKKLEDQLNVRFKTAAITDVPTYVWTLPMILRKAEVEFFIQGYNTIRAPFAVETEIDLRKPYWWEGFGKRRIFTLASSYATGEKLGLKEGMESMVEKIPAFLKRYEKNYPADVIFVYGYLIENQPFDLKFLENIRKWNKKWAFPRLRLCTLREVFETFKKHFGERIKVYRFDGGTYWEDGVASTAKETAIHRKNQRDIITLEKLASLLTLFGRISYPEEKLDEIWRLILLFNEHTWGALHSVIRPRLEFTKKVWREKASYAYRAKEELDQRFRDIGKDFASLFNSDKDTKIIVFNPLSWERKGLVKLKLPSEIANTNIEIFDESTGKKVKSQIEENHLYFIAEKVPPLGFKTFSMVSSKKILKKRMSKRRGSFIENQYYRISAEKSGNVEVFDKEVRKRLAKNKGKFKFNQLLYVTGGTGTRIINYTFNTAANLKLHTPAKIKRISIKKGNVMEKLILTYENLPLFKNITSEWTLYRDLKAIEIKNSFYKQETFRKEALYFAFPFNMKSPEVYLEVPYGWMRPEKDQIKGACKEWFSVQNWIAFFGKEHSIVLSAPDSLLFTFGDINRGRWPEKLEIKEALAFAYLLNNYWFTNYKAGQAGHFSFRFYISSSKKLSLPESMKKGWEFVFPLRAFLLLKGNKGIIRKSFGSFLKISASNVILTAFKKAENGKGFVLRLREIRGEKTRFSINFPYFLINKVFLCDITEKELRPLFSRNSTVYLDIAPYDVLTLKFEFKNISQW